MIQLDLIVNRFVFGRKAIRTFQKRVHALPLV